MIQHARLVRSLTVAIFATLTAFNPMAHADLAEDYLKDIRPLMERKCYDCHDADALKGDLNLERFKSFDDIKAEPELWQNVLQRVQAYEMPPKKAGELNYGQFEKMMGFLRKLPKVEQPDCNQIASDRTASYYRGYVMSRRLNRAEYINTIRDLFGVEHDFKLEQLLPADGGGGEGFDTTGDTLFTSSIHIEKYLAAAEQVTQQVLPDSPRGQTRELRAARERLLFRQPGWFGKVEPAAREVIAAFTRRAWRRPVTEPEVDELMKLFMRADARGDSFAASIRLAVQGALISPHFLFLAEPEPSVTGVQPLADVPLASKLSYFLWSSMPDVELLTLAELGKLSDTNIYRAQLDRMLKDPKAAALGERFALQWLNLDQLGGEVKPDPTKFPEFDAALARAMKGEVATFFNHLVREDRSLLELIDSRYTFANARLAQLYGLPGVQGDELQYVQLADARRGGLIGMAGVHALTSYPVRTSPVLRGRWLLESLLGDKIPPPPPDVPALDEKAAEKPGGLSLRKQLELHRVKAECAACHDKMDPLGFGLENFDSLGRWREELHGEPVEAKGTLPSGEVYEGPDGLKQVLMARKERIMRHLARKMTGFAFGRELNKFDNCVIDDAMTALATNDWRATVLIETIAMSYPFRHRFYPKHDQPES
ncbi:MAG: DUF1592 domain-containing protein [Verrucomicrobiae bacterium]|nr:DUF1592 domain-containing protein [Verrucomicrobiae bacterium]